VHPSTTGTPMRLHTLLLALSLSLLSPILLAEPTADTETAEHKETVQDFSSTIDIFSNSPEATAFFKNAYGYALFPTIGKGGFGIGAAHGRGQVYAGGRVTGFTTMTQLSVGFQVGGQAFSQIIFFQDKRAYDEFVSGNFEFDASASAVAITAGVQARAGTTGSTAGATAGPATGRQFNTEYHRGMATFIHAKGGLMYQAVVAGQKFSFKPL
jgi:lipid-binding SYLF domain-containing protein